MPASTTETLTIHGQVPFQSLGLPSTEDWAADFVKDSEGRPLRNLIQVTFTKPFVDTPSVVVSVNHDLVSLAEMTAVVDPSTVQLVQARAGSFIVSTGAESTTDFSYQSCTFTFVAVGEFQSSINF